MLQFLFDTDELTFRQQQIHYPAAANMLAGLAAVVKDVRIGAAGVFERVAEDGHPVEGPAVVDGLCQRDDGGRLPGGIDGDGAEGVAEDVAE